MKLSDPAMQGQEGPQWNPEPVDIEEKRLRVRWALSLIPKSGKRALNKGCGSCVLQLHQDSDHRTRLILQDEGSEVSGITFLIGFEQ